MGKMLKKLMERIRSIAICFDLVFLYLVVYHHALRLRHRVNVTLPQS